MFETIEILDEMDAMAAYTALSSALVDSDEMDAPVDFQSSAFTFDPYVS